MTPQSAAGSWNQAVRGQRRIRNAPATTKRTKPRWMTSTTSARNPYSTRRCYILGAPRSRYWRASLEGVLTGRGGAGRDPARFRRSLPASPRREPPSPPGRIVLLREQPDGWQPVRIDDGPYASLRDLRLCTHAVMRAIPSPPWG